MLKFTFTEYKKIIFEYILKSRIKNNKDLSVATKL